MNEAKYRRISNANDTVLGAISGKNEHMSFEAKFILGKAGELMLHGRGVDSNGVEIISSSTQPIVFGLFEQIT